MVRLLKKLLILFFDILYVVMFAFAIGFVRYYRFDFKISDFLIATVLYTAFRIYHRRKNKDKPATKAKFTKVLPIWIYLFLLILLPMLLVWVKKTFPVQIPISPL